MEHGFFGGHIFLDFVNTIDDEHKTRVFSAIPDWMTALEWATAVRVISDSELKSLAHPRHKADAEAELEKLHVLREQAWQVLSHCAAGNHTDDAQLSALARVVHWACEQAALKQNGRSFRWSVSMRTNGLSLVRTRLALALSDLLTHQDLDNLRECGRCTGLFLDRGRGVGRRWCRMKTCGNRAKSARFRRKDAAGLS